MRPAGWLRRVAPLLALLAGACDAATSRPAPGVAGADVATPVAGAQVGPLADSTFARMVAELSEPEQYFDTDNLISNEASYLHAVTELESRGIRGGAYLGVGPGQSFSYLAAVRPRLAFLVDIRRDNLLQHLWYRGLFELAETRLDYLCLLLSRDCGGASADLSVEALIRTVEAAPRVADVRAAAGRVIDAAEVGVPLSSEDRAFMTSVHERFAAAGPDLRFNTHGRAPRAYYPTLRRLLLERDLDGDHASYLASEEGYRFVDALQEANRVVPVVGDLAGDHALRAVGRELSGRGLAVSAFYVSNVEFYLFDGRFPRFIDNLAALPVREDGVIIRSYFNRFRPIPETVPGYASTQLVQSVSALLAAWEEGRIRSYRDLIVGVRGG